MRNDNHQRLERVRDGICNMARHAAIFALALFSAFVSTVSPAVADNVLAPPPDKFVISAGGVDMRSGRYAYNHTDLSIGGDSGLALTRTMTQLGSGRTNPFGSFSHNFDISVLETFGNNQTGDFSPGNGGVDPQVQINFGGRAQTYRTLTGSSWDRISRANFGILTPPPIAKAISPPGILTYQDSDGTTLVFRPIGGGDCPGLCAYVSTLTRADGTLLTFQYDSDPASGDSRLRSVVSTRGQAILFEYSGLYVTKACALNLAVTAKPASNICPSGVPTATYTYDMNAGEQRLASVTDPSGALWRFVNGTTTETDPLTNTPASITMGFINPGDTAPWLTNRIYKEGDDYGSTWDVVTAQAFADGRSYTYAYNLFLAPPHRPVIAGGTITDGQGHETKVTYDFPVLPGTAPGDPCHSTPCPPTQIEPGGDSSVVFQMTSGPASVTAPNRGTTTYDYCDPVATDGCQVAPEALTTTGPTGITTYMTWDFLTHHLAQTREVAVAGSGFPDVIRSAAYNCLTANIRFCDKPTAATDANGNVTNLTYAPEHGGILSEMQPTPSAGAPRPLKLTSWVQKYAWYKNASGVLAQAPSPVYVIASETECQTVAGANNGTAVCDAAAQKRVTTYQYGADGTADNLDVRGAVVTADGVSRRTCFSYDNLGNKLSETSPRAGLATCP